MGIPQARKQNQAKKKFFFFTVRATALWQGKALIYSEEKPENNQNIVFIIHCKRHLYKVHLEDWNLVLVHILPLQFTRITSLAVGRVLKTSLSIPLKLPHHCLFSVVSVPATISNTMKYFC